LVAFGLAAEPAIPALVGHLRETLESQDAGSRNEIHPVILALPKIAPGTSSAGQAIAALIEVVRSPSLHTAWRARAAESLGAFGPAAEPAISALVDALHEAFAGKDGIPSVGWAVARALGRIAPGTKAADTAFAALTEALDGPRHVRLGAIPALADFGPKAASVVLQLRAWQRDSDPSLAKSATLALKAIEGAPAGDRKGDEGDRQDRVKP
jgi:hypothetical protein